MSGLHYKSNGTLDMRYSSSRSAVASGYGGGGGGGWSGNSSSSRSVASSGYGGGGSGNKSVGSSSDLHYKKDGTLDMRYGSSKEMYASVPCTSMPNCDSGGSGDLHYKKDGTLDMRYSSSQSAVDVRKSISRDSGGSDVLHHKKDGSLDMRYKSSKELAKDFQKLSLSTPGIPDSIPLTKAGLPDMRTTVAKAWVKQQAQKSGGGIPEWVPKLKDGSVDYSKVPKAVFNCLDEGNRNAADHYDPQQRLKHYTKLLEAEAFQKIVKFIRKKHIPPLPPSTVLANTESLRMSLAKDQLQQMSYVVPQISYTDLQLEPLVELGRGSFGVVLKGLWKGNVVAVKKTHLKKLNCHEQKSFLNEIKILGYLGLHVNLICLYAYVVEPPCLVLEYVDMGSLSHLLHYEEDLYVQAKMTDGRIKQQIVVGIAFGMIQLHEVNVVHGDLKPQNVLVTKDWTAKITDFGLATLRGKTSCCIASGTTDDADHVIGGTGAYMAPELLDSTGPSELSSDVYSFAVLMNEVLQEEEPYWDQLRNIFGRGPFGAVNYAKLGSRPNIGPTTPLVLQQLIKSCWAKDPKQRPNFKQIASELQKPEMSFPNFF